MPLTLAIFNLLILKAYYNSLLSQGKIHSGWKILLPNGPNPPPFQEKIKIRSTCPSGCRSVTSQRSLTLFNKTLNFCQFLTNFYSPSILHCQSLTEERPRFPLFSRMSILPIHSIVSLQTCIFMHNCYSDKLPSSLNNYFNLNCSVHVYNTRNKNNFHPPLFRILNYLNLL